MARVTHVKRAQQRYETKPVLDDEGQPKRTLIRRPDGTPKLTRGGREQYMPVVERDLSKPKPMPRCGSCGKDIEAGTPYKWIEPHGRGQMTRHEACPTWNVWEYSYSLSARTAQLDHEGNGMIDSWESDDAEDLKTVASDIASSIRELADEKQEAADNMESGFGHETEQSQELADIADQLQSWADDVENVDLPEKPEECEACGGNGVKADTEDECPECQGEKHESRMEDWAEEARQAVRDALGECPV